MKTKIEATLVDHSSESYDENTSLDVIIEITEQGVLIYPKEVKQHYSGIFRREIWVEFYLSTLRVLGWDGTQEDPVMTEEILQP